MSQDVKDTGTFTVQSFSSRASAVIVRDEGVHQDLLAIQILLSAVLLIMVILSWRKR